MRCLVLIDWRLFGFVMIDVCLALVIWVYIDWLFVVVVY